MEFSDVEIAHLKETLLTCREDFEELYRTREWFVSDALDLIESSLEILNNKDVNGKAKDTLLGPRNK